jgi:hypothetical protein
MRWTTLQKERGQIVLDFTNTLQTKIGIKDSERNLVLKYHGDLHRYVQIEMDFLYISSLGASYRYVVKIETKFKNQKNGSSSLQTKNNQSMIKMALINNLLKTIPSHKKIRITGRQRTPENVAISTKSLGTTPINVAQDNHWWLREKTRRLTLIQNLILKILVKY